MSLGNRLKGTVFEIWWWVALLVYIYIYIYVLGGWTDGWTALVNGAGEGEI